MSQMTAGGTRRKGGGLLDIYTGLALAGTVALLLGLGILWMAGSELAAGESENTAMPWQILSGS